MTIALLGPLCIDGDPVSLSPRDRVVLGALSIRPGQLVSAQGLATALWGDQPPASAAKVVQGCVGRLRKTLGSEAIQTEAGGYRLVVPPDDIDSCRFERLARRSAELLALGEHDRAAYTGRLALAIWRGPPLHDLDGWESGQIEAGRLDEVRLDTEDVVLEAALQGGHHREVLTEAHARVAEAPLRERRWALLALAQYQAGRQGDALRTLAQSRRMLLEELGVDPGSDLRSLELAILHHDPSLAASPVAAAADDVCPYLGLVAYDVDDADSYFGRTTDLARSLAILEREGVLALVGPSGSGKTSLVRAGIVAALRRNGRGAVVITPGEHPMRSLAALPTGGPTPTLVVDQCEEAVTRCDDFYERSCFFAALAERATRAPLVVVVRADRLGDISTNATLARLLERGLHLLGPMSGRDLRAAIEGPAHQAGLRLEPGLVDLLQRDTDGEPGGLPLLSHTLRKTWEHREGRTLTVAGYQLTGGIHAAVARSAEEIYEGTPEPQRPILRDLLLRLVAPNPLGDPHRVRVPRRMIATDPQRAELIERLVTARLVTSDEGSVELAHESLARVWPRLRSWLDDDVDGQRIRRHLTVAADDWDRLKRPDSELYRGVRLARALDWQRGAPVDLAPIEQEFLDQSRAKADHDRRDSEHRILHERKVNRRLKTLVAGVASLLIVAVVAGLLGKRQADRADAATTTADARRVGAQALATPDVDRSLLLAVEAVRLDDSPQTRASLLATVARNPLLVASARSAQPPSTIDLAPNQSLLAVGSPLGGVELRDVATLRLVGRTDLPATQLQFHPDGRQLAVVADPTASGEATSVVLVDVDTQRPSATQLGGLPELPAMATDVSFSADGRLIAVTFDRPITQSPSTSLLMVWDTSTPSIPARQLDVPGRHPALTLSPNGTTAFVGTIRLKDERWLTVLDIPTGTIARETYLDAGVTDVSPDGTVLAAVDHHDAIILDAATLDEQLRLEAHTPLADEAWFSPSGRQLVTASQDGKAVVWDIQPTLGGPRPDGGRLNRQRAQLEGHAAQLTGAVFSADGDSLYTVSADRSLLAWDLGGARRFVPLASAGGTSPRSRLVVREQDGVLQVLDETRWPIGEPVSLGRDAERQFASSDARLGIAWAGATLTLVDFERGVVTHELTTGWQPEWAAFSPDGRQVAVTGQAGEVGLLDVATGRWLAPPTIGHRALAHRVEWSPDGRTFATGGHDGRVGLWDGATGAPIGVVPVGAPEDTATPVYSSDGDAVVISTGRGVSYRWDLRPARWIEFACAVAGRDLTPEEWLEAFGDRPYRPTCPAR